MFRDSIQRIRELLSAPSLPSRRPRKPIDPSDGPGMATDREDWERSGRRFDHTGAELGPALTNANGPWDSALTRGGQRTIF